MLTRVRFPGLAYGEDFVGKAKSTLVISSLEGLESHGFWMGILCSLQKKKKEIDDVETTLFLESYHMLKLSYSVSFRSK